MLNVQEAIAVGRSFATMKGYRLDGNKEMLAMGVMNITGSLTSCYVATGQFFIYTYYYYYYFQTTMFVIVQ